MSSQNKEEKLEDYAVDVRHLKGVHERVVAKRTEIEALVADERGLGSLQSLSDEAKEHLSAEVDQMLSDWEKEKSDDGTGVTGSPAFNKLALEHFALEQQILDAEDDQVEEASTHPFKHPLR